MNKIPYKVRIGLGAGLFLWSVGAVIATIIFSQQGLGVWVLIVGPTLAAISFVLFVIIMPLITIVVVPFSLNESSKLM